MRPLSRRHLLLATAALVACGGASPEPAPASATDAGPQLPTDLDVLRRWEGSGHAVVVATGHGDPRLRPGSDAVMAHELLTALHDAGFLTFVAATGTAADPGLAMFETLPPEQRAPALEAGLRRNIPEDAARVLAVARQVQLVEGGDDEASAIGAVARLHGRLWSADSELAATRRLALAGVEEATASWAEARQGHLFTLSEAESAVQRALSGRAGLASPPAVWVTSALAAPALAAALEAKGFGGALVATPPAASVLWDDARWWAWGRAGLPEPGGAGLQPWVGALGPYAEAMDAWPERAEVERQIEAHVGPTPAELPAGHRLRGIVEAAAERLSSPPAELDAVPLAEAPMEGMVMSYDAFHHRLKVSQRVETWPEPLVAAVLLHELVHVADVRAAAEALGTDPRGWAMILDTLPVGLGRDVRLSMESHAYGVELDALADLGVTLPEPGAPPGDSDAARTRAMLASMAAVDRSSAAWVRALGGTVPTVRRQAPAEER